MSAVNIFETPEGAMIFTDGAMYDADGVLVGIAPKCHLTQLGLVVTGRGNAAFPHMVLEALDRLRWKIDDVEEQGEELIEAGFQKVEAAFLQASGKAFCNIWIAGWSFEGDRAKVLQWSNCPPAGVPRFKLVESVLAPDLTPEGYRRVHLAMAGADPRNPDFGRMGLAVMKSQRLDQGSAEFFSEGKYLVGGHIMRTDVTRAGVKQHVVHEWPEDRIGERIRPAPEIDPSTAPNVTPIAGGNRAERRRAEKLARKTRVA